MAEIDSDSEIVFQPRYEGGGEQLSFDHDKMCQHVESGDESEGEDEQNVDAEIQDGLPVPGRNNRVPDNERRQNRQHVYQRRRDDMAFPPMTENKLLMKPDTYNGDGDWESYIAHFELCAELGGWSPRVMALTLATRLQGQARVFYMNLSNRQKNSYAELVKNLGQRFGYTRQKSTWVSRLESRQRLQGETISTFGDDIRQLTQRAHADLDPSAQEAIALNQLFKSISPEMKYRCIVAQCKTVAQAVEMVEIYEGVVGAEGSKKKNIVRMAREEPNQGNIKSVETGLSELRQTMDQVIGRIEKLEKRCFGPTETSNKRACFICQSTDHLMNRCPNKNQENKRNVQNGQYFKNFNKNQQSTN